MPPGHSTDKPQVTQDEVSFILRKCLRPEHQANPTVIRFINEYLLTRDARQSARTLGLEPKMGTYMRNQPDIFEAIRALTERAVMKYGYDAAEIVEKVKEIAFIDPADLQNDDGTYVDNIKLIPPEVRRAIKKMKVRNEYGEDPNGMKIITGKVIEYEFWDKMKAVELLGREKQVFTETRVIQHDVGKNMATTLLDSKRRGEERANGVREVVVVEVESEESDD